MVLAALVLGLCLVASAFVFTSQKREESQLVNKSISVTGRATKFVTADTLKWSISLSRDGASSSTEQTLLREVDGDVDFIKQKLTEAGATDIVVSRQPHRYTKGYCSSYPDYHYDERPTSGSAGAPAPAPQEYCSGGNIYQTVIFEAKNADKANMVTGAMSGLLSDRKAWMSDSQTNFLIANEEDLRRELMDTALQDARTKAEKLAPGRIGSLLRTMDEQLAITAKNESTSAYYYGGYDQASVDKKVILTLPVTFSVTK